MEANAVSNKNYFVIEFLKHNENKDIMNHP